MKKSASKKPAVRRARKKSSVIVATPKDEVSAAVNKAFNSSKWLIVAFRRVDDVIYYDRISAGFLTEDIELAKRLFAQAVDEMKE